jgi:succinate dehydrogenase/fumarate reductase-like Fe-S protein
MLRTAIPLLALCLACLTACSEDRSDIENLEPKVLEDEANALTESAAEATAEQLEKIQPAAIEAAPNNGDGDKNTY